MKTICEVTAMIGAFVAIVTAYLGHTLEAIFLILLAIFVIKLWQIGGGK
jgi:hypothetical protein